MKGSDSVGARDAIRGLKKATARAVDKGVSCNVKLLCK
jgi:hypothetical protein